MIQPSWLLAFLTFCNFFTTVRNEFQCSQAIPLYLGEIVNGTTESATVQLETTSNVCGNAMAMAAPGVWFQYQATAGAGQVTITTCTDNEILNGRFDSHMLVFTGSCANLNCVAGNDDVLGDDCGTEAGVTLATSTPGLTYYVLVYGLDTIATGNFAVQVRSSVPNDICTRGSELDLARPLLGSTKGATADPASVDNVCGSARSISSPGVWYKYDANGNGQVYITTSVDHASLYSSDLESQILVYTGSCGNLNCIGGSNNARQGVKISTVRGRRYYILVYGDREDSMGNFEVQVRPSIANDICSGAHKIKLGEFVRGTTKGAFPDDESTTKVCGTAVSSRSPGVWFKYRARSNKQVNITTCKYKHSHHNTKFDSQILVFTGRCDDLQCVAGNDDVEDGDCDTKAGLMIATTRGETYHILVYGFSATMTGNFGIRVKKAYW